MELATDAAAQAGGLRDTISGRKAAAGLVQPETRWAEDPSGVRMLDRHFHRLTPLVLPDAEASGLMVLTRTAACGGA